MLDPPNRSLYSMSAIDEEEVAGDNAVQIVFGFVSCQKWLQTLLRCKVFLILAEIYRLFCN